MSTRRRRQIRSRFFVLSLRAGKDSRWTRHLAAEYLISEFEIYRVLHKAAPLSFSSRIKMGLGRLNIRDARRHLRTTFGVVAVSREANFEPENVEKANSVVGAEPTGLRPRSAYVHPSLVVSARNIFPRIQRGMQ